MTHLAQMHLHRPEKGWQSAITIGSGLVALTAFLAFILVERTAKNPIVPFSLFFDRNQLATSAATFLTGGVTFTVAVLIALYVQNIPLVPQRTHDPRQPSAASGVKTGTLSKPRADPVGLQ